MSKERGSRKRRKESEHTNPQLCTNLQVAGGSFHEGKCFPEGSTEPGQILKEWVPGSGPGAGRKQDPGGR